MGRSRSENARLWLICLRRRSSKRVERVLAHRPLHTRLVSVHSHSHPAAHTGAHAHSTSTHAHSTSTHAHSTWTHAHTAGIGTQAHSTCTHRLLLGGHGVHTAHILHSSAAHPGHRLERHRLEPTRSWWLLHSAEIVSLSSLRLLSRISVHKLSERIRPRQLLLRLELIWLQLSTCARLLRLVIVVETLKHGEFVGFWYGSRVGSQGLVARREYISQGVRGFAGVGTAALRRIGRKNVEQVVCHIIFGDTATTVGCCCVLL